MNWDDLRFLLAVSEAGSLAQAAKRLEVDHTTVGRRVEAIERTLGLKLFTRTTSGYVRTLDAERLLEPLKRVESAMHDFERLATSTDALEGPVRVTSPETFGASYLAPRLAQFSHEHPQVRIDLVPSGTVLDLGRREAQLAVRPFRSKQDHLVVQRVGSVSYGLYATHAYVKRRPLRSPDELHHHALFSSVSEDDLEARWLKKLDPRARPTFASTLSLALLAAVKTGSGLAVLPCYLGDADPTLTQVRLREPPREDIWLTVHRDLQKTPRVRVLLDFLARTIRGDRLVLEGRG